MEHAEVKEMTKPIMWVGTATIASALSLGRSESFTSLRYNPQAQGQGHRTIARPEKRGGNTGFRSGAPSLATFPKNFLSDRLVVLCWPVERTVIWVWLQRSNKCSLLYLIAADIFCRQWTFVITNFWRFCSESACLWFRCSAFSLWVNCGNNSTCFSQGISIVTFRLAEANRWLAAPFPLILKKTNFLKEGMKGGGNGWRSILRWRFRSVFADSLKLMTVTYPKTSGRLSCSLKLIHCTEVFNLYLSTWPVQLTNSRFILRSSTDALPRVVYSNEHCARFGRALFTNRHMSLWPTCTRFNAS